MAAKSTKKVIEKNNSYKKTILISIFAGFFLLITNSAIWVNNQIFDTKNFTTTVTNSLTSESSRQAIAQQVTDKMFEQRPVAKRVAGNFSTKLIGGLLDTDQFKNILTPAVERMQAYATSNDQQSVVIELGGVKDIVTKITNVSESFGNEARINPENIPDQILLINEDSVPDLYKIGVIFLWLAPLCFLTALILIAYPYVKKLNDKRKILAIQGSVITVAGLIGLLVGPLFKPPVLSSISEPNSRVVVGNLYDAFISTFNSQTIFLALIGVLLILITTVWTGYPYAKKSFASIKSNKKL